MPALYRCKHCGELHPIPFPFETEDAFQAFEFSRHLFTCETTGESAMYGDEDFQWQDPDRESSER